MKAKINKQIQSMFTLVLLFSALILTTGCFNKEEHALVSTNGRTRHLPNKFPDVPSRPNNPHPSRPEQTQNAGWISIDLAHDDALIEEVAEVFIGERINGNLQDIQIRFYNDGYLALAIWDDQAISENYSPFQFYLETDGYDDQGFSYSDNYGIVDLDAVEELEADQYTFQVSFENRDGQSGILGYVSLYLCEIEGTC